MNESEPSTFEEVVDEQVWRDVVVDEYSSIMRNDAWETMSGPEGNSMVIS